MNDLVSSPSVPLETTYSVKNSMVKSSKLRTNVYPLNKGASYSAGSQIIWNIPNIANSYLVGDNAYLRLEVTFTNSAGTDYTINIDNNAHAFIQKLEIFSADGTQLESINYYNELATALVDVSYTLADRTSLLSATSGVEDLVSGNAFTNLRKGHGFTVTANSTYTYTYCIPIVSGLFSNAERYLPVHKLAGELRAEFTLNDRYGVMVGQNANNISWVVSDAQLVLEYLQIHDTALINSITPDTVVIHSTSWRTFTNTISTSMTAGSFQTFQIPFRGSSAKLVLFSARNAPTSTYYEYNGSSRTHCFTDLQMNIGGQLFPNKKLTGTTTCVSEFIVELQKCFQSWSSTTAYNGALPNTYLTKLCSAPTANSYTNSMLYGLDLETVEKRSDRILSGMDCRTALTFLQATMCATPATTHQLNSFVHHDVIYVVSPDGRISSRY